MIVKLTDDSGKSPFKPTWKGTGIESPQFGKVEKVTVFDDEGEPLYDQYRIWEGPRDSDGNYAATSGAVVLPYYKKGNITFIGILSRIRPIVIDPESQKCGHFVSLEIPRGFADLHEGSDSKATAARELGEETGKHLKQITFIGKCNPNTVMYVTPGIPIFAAEVDSGIATHSAKDPTEVILKCTFYPLEKVREMIRKGEIIDGFTLAALACFESQINSLK